MAGPGEIDKPVTVADRFDAYRIEIEKIVARGIEHANYELKRSVTISKDNLADRLDFVKLIQGLANAGGGEERFIVIGADQKERKFYEVPNASDFDPAKLGPILAKYLDPQPQIEVFNTIRSEGGEAYVLVVLSPGQPRPIVTVCEGTSDKKSHFRQGEIWVKRDTSLQLASRSDLDLMYEKHIDDEAENRARRRFEHFSKHLKPTIYANPATSMPGRTLLVGDRDELHAFAESTIAAGETVKLKMLIEMARERLVDEWGRVTPPTFFQETEISAVVEFHRDGFVASLDSIVDVGLHIIKFVGSEEWLELIVSMLLDSFEVSRLQDRRNSGLAGRDRRETLFAYAAYEVYMAVRALATYAMMRQRFRFLKAILPRMVAIFMSDHYDQMFAPLIFWPFHGDLGLPVANGGRNRALWDAHIGTAWIYHFGTKEAFLAAASQLEFILEFNSYLLVSLQSPAVEKVKSAGFGNVYFAYQPDFWASPLNDTIPIAERVFDMLESGTGLPPDLTINKSTMDAAFAGKKPRERLMILAAFLIHLKSWQVQAMMQFRKFVMFNWEGRLKTVTEMYQADQASSKKAT